MVASNKEHNPKKSKICDATFEKTPCLVLSLLILINLHFAALKLLAKPVLLKKRFCFEVNQIQIEQFFTLETILNISSMLY